jgi:hypothetical protein
MKKTTGRHITNQELPRQRGLRLAQETIRALSVRELAQAVSGCDTTSVTTEVPQASRTGC